MPKLYATFVRRTSKWDQSKPPQEQPGFPLHVEYMNGLKAENFIALAGLLMTSSEILFVFRADSEEQVRERMGADPWQQSGLARIERVEELAVSIGAL